ncbi:MAG: MgtC/SapB family protein [Candidatus Thorarchaeota archaeon]|nr:MgtC/SapB family protein [Candidatus Thorarchaeota archaeon]
MQSVFSSPDVIIRCLLGFAVGALIGLERQKRMTEGEGIGVRSFGLHSLFGMLAAYSFTVSANPIIMIYAACISAIFVSTQVVHKVFRTTRKGLTTSIAFGLVFILGALVGLDKPVTAPQLVGPLATLSMTVSFMVFLVLGFKEEVSAAVAVITKEEMISAVELAVLILFLWPLMPQSISILGISFPVFQTYILIVLLLGISFANYILVKKYKNRGPYFFGFFGGLANSEATVTSLAEFHVATKHANPGRISLGAIFANLAMVLRNTLLVVLLDPTLRVFQYYMVPLAILVFMGLFRLARERRYAEMHHEGEIDMKLVSPFELGAAVRFATLFTLVSLTSLVLQMLFNDQGVLFAAMIGGIASAGAVVAAVVPLYSAGTISLSVTVLAATLATATSVMNKVFYVYLADNKGELMERVAKDALIMAVGLVFYVSLILAGAIPLPDL